MTQEEFTVEFRALSEQQRRVVHDTLQFVLDSPHFRKSARYPALLQFLVLNALDGNLEVLKERVIGVEVFGRPADYDTSSDSVVRMAASEVRKRVAFYFSEHPDAPVRIELPGGSYIAEFHFRSQSTVGTPSDEPHTDVGDVQSHAVSDAIHSIPKYLGRRVRITGRGVVVALVLLLFVLGATVSSYLHNRQKREFWWPVLHNDVPVLIIVGEDPGKHPSANVINGTSDQTSAQTGLTFGDAVVVAQICSTFRKYDRDCKIVSAKQAMLADLRNKSVVLVGAFNNEWTQTVLAQLRYQFKIEAPASLTTPRMEMVIDGRNTKNVSPWMTPTNPSAGFNKDYAIIARFHSDVTNGTVVVVAGFRSVSTVAAGEFVCSPEELREITSLAPKNWKGLNMEAVLQVGVVQENPGHAKIVATEFW